MIDGDPVQLAVVIALVTGAVLLVVVGLVLAMDA